MLNRRNAPGHPSQINISHEFSLSERTIKRYRHAIRQTRTIVVNLKALKPLLALALAPIPCLAESGYVNILVEDAHQHPIPLVEIGIEKGASKLTKDDGRAQLPLASNITADDWISFQLVHSPPGKDLAIVSPWDNRIPVPSFADNPQNLIKIVVVQRGDRAALESGTILASLTAKINKANAPKAANAPPPDPKEALLTVARQYGLTADDIDTAIRAWGEKTTDPYEAGLAALYERNYPKATSALQDSLRQREERLKADQQRVIQDQKDVADAACFLGQSQYGQLNYQGSVLSYKRCLEFRPDNPTSLNNLALSLEQLGDYAAAEPLFRRALDLNEKVLGNENPEILTILINLAAVLTDKKDYVQAARLLIRARELAEKTSNQPQLARSLDGLAVLLAKAGEFARAEQLLHEALAIDQKVFGPDHPEVATDLSNLAQVMVDKGDYASAEPLFRRALAIDEKALGPDHPEVADCLVSLGAMLEDKGKYTEAEPLLRRALAIYEKILGPDHPAVARALLNQALLLSDQGNFSGAVPLIRRAIAIDEKTFGPDDLTVAADLNNLAAAFENSRDYAAAEPLFRRTLAIREKNLGPNDPGVAIDLANLASALEGQNNYAAAEPLLRRALVIDEKALGPHHPKTTQIRKQLLEVENHRISAKQNRE